MTTRIYDVDIAAERARNLLSQDARKVVTEKLARDLVLGDYQDCHARFKKAVEADDSSVVFALNEFENAMLVLGYWKV